MDEKMWSRERLRYTMACRSTWGGEGQMHARMARYMVLGRYLPRYEYHIVARMPLLLYE